MEQNEADSAAARAATAFHQRAIDEAEALMKS